MYCVKKKLENGKIPLKFENKLFSCLKICEAMLECLCVYNTYPYFLYLIYIISIYRCGTQNILFILRKLIFKKNVKMLNILEMYSFSYLYK